MKGSQMYDPIECGIVEGGVFSTIGSTEEEQDELTAVITEQLSATVSPISGYKTPFDNTIQCAALRPQMNILTLRPSWS